ncbi:MAG: hypothetical protein OJF52_001168 [Nitrospira sp.]|jgi:hypothetical protein|nr:MAG: hypothetical protein OJF52_001168 [Nitrospira sp.]
MSGRKITRMLQKIGKRAGVTVSPHRLRKSGATDTTTNGTDLKTLQEILGHSDIRTTAKYVRPNPVHQAQAMRRLKVGPLLQVANKRSTPSHPQPRAQTLRSKAKRKTPLKKTKGHPGRSART